MARCLPARSHHRGRLNAFKLKLLEDDKHYFPDYTAALCGKSRCWSGQAHPQLMLTSSPWLVPSLMSLKKTIQRRVERVADVDRESPFRCRR